MKALVAGLGKAISGGGVEYFEGDHCEAELLEQLWPNSENWFVHFPGDNDDEGNPIRRIRRVVEFL